MKADIPAADRVMTVAEVALLFRVDPATVGRWVKRGKLKIAFRTPGGHIRFREETVRGFLKGGAP